MPTPPDAEAAIRRYLQYLADPGSLVDHAAVAAVEAELASATDPIDKLHLFTRLERARSADSEGVKLGFIMHAKAWADEQQITPAAFQHLGVPDDVLHAAGFALPGRPARAPRRARSEPSAPRARSVSTEEIRAHVLAHEGRFRLAEVMDAVGGSPLTVRKAVEDLVNDGKVERIGPDPDHHGRGRAPILYERR